jgi:hypothetical protein
MPIGRHPDEPPFVPDVLKKEVTHEDRQEAKQRIEGASGAAGVAPILK